MKSKGSKTSQKEVDLLSDLVWTQLESQFGKAGKKPPVYLFLSAQSKGSLKGRDLVEKNFVHHQQILKGGVTLDSPPTAWVSNLEQTPEETAHLFALKKGQRAKKSMPLHFYILHEAFARFSERLLYGSAPSRQDPPRRSRTSRLSYWHQIHKTGYRMGDAWARQWYDEEIHHKDLKVWFSGHWSSKKSLKKILIPIKKFGIDIQSREQIRYR